MIAWPPARPPTTCSRGTPASGSSAARRIAGGRARLQGYRDAIRASGRSVNDDHVAMVEFTRAGGRSGLAAVLDGGDPPDAVLCANDVIALGAIDLTVARALSVPGVSRSWDGRHRGGRHRESRTHHGAKSRGRDRPGGGETLDVAHQRGVHRRRPGCHRAARAGAPRIGVSVSVRTMRTARILSRRCALPGGPCGRPGSRWRSCRSRTAPTGCGRATGR